ncbi:MAG: histidinol-phosphate transaminase [Candidatus Neomarinimicrobiota bacterium]|jgi:histidinol-phosphate aminotransferase
MIISDLVRDNVKKMKKYASAREEFKGEAKIFLDANENSFGSSSNEELNRYPEPIPIQLRKKLADYKKINDPEKIFLGNGSDEAIDLVMRAFCEPREDSIMLLPPTYGMYSVCANVNDLDIIQVNLNPDFSLNVKKIIQQAKDEKPKLIIICTPNNPSGNVYRNEDIEEILNNVPSLVLIDEAYIDFSSKTSWLERLDEFKNLIVIQTFSKAWGMAGIRLGMAFADKEIIDILNKIKYPYNINDVTTHIVLETLNDTSKKEDMVSKIIIERAYLMKEIAKIDILNEVLPSEANFFLARFNEAKKVYAFLKEQGIVVRDRSEQLHCEGCLRITVGRREENDMLLDALRQYSEEDQS